MKKLFIFVIVYMMVFGCAGVSLKPVANDCINKADYPNSIILQKLDNPCVPHKVLVSLAKSGMALDNITYDELHKKIKEYIEFLNASQSISARAVKDVILAEITKVNAVGGAIAFVMSDTFLLFSNETIFISDDIKVLIASLMDIDAQAKAMSSLIR